MHAVAAGIIGKLPKSIIDNDNCSDVTVQLDNSVSDLEELQAESLKYAVTIEMICKPIGW